VAFSSVLVGSRVIDESLIGKVSGVVRVLVWSCVFVNWDRQHLVEVVCRQKVAPWRYVLQKVLQKFLQELLSEIYGW
jgi:hypothetical protein